jgi:hypothetical protein
MLSRVEEIGIILNALDAKKDRMLTRLSQVRMIASANGMDYKTHPVYTIINDDLKNLEEKIKSYKNCLKLICVSEN